MKRKVVICMFTLDIYDVHASLKLRSSCLDQNSYCLESSLNHTKAKGNILVCRHAGNSVESKRAKATEVNRAGGVGLILIDEADNDIAVPFAIPAAVVGHQKGHKILSYITKTRYDLSSIVMVFLIISAAIQIRHLFSPLI